MSESASLESLTSRVIEFVEDRDWAQFHNPKDLAISLCLEASEVLELMQWKSEEDLKSKLRDQQDHLAGELADVLYWVLLLAHQQEIDLGEAFESKLKENALKYPVSLSKGSSKKYDQL